MIWYKTLFLLFFNFCFRLAVFFSLLCVFVAVSTAQNKTRVWVCVVHVLPFHFIFCLLLLKFVSRCICNGNNTYYVCINEWVPFMVGIDSKNMIAHLFYCCLGPFIVIASVHTCDRSYKYTLSMSDINGEEKKWMMMTTATVTLRWMFIKNKMNKSAPLIS